MHPSSTPTRLPRWGPRGWLRCSSVTYSRYAPSSRLAIRAPRRPRCDNELLRRDTRLGACVLAFRSFAALGVLGVLCVEPRRGGRPVRVRRAILDEPAIQEPA